MIDEKKLIENIEYYISHTKEESGEHYAYKKAKKLIESQPKVGDWIPCSKQTPEESDYYMACIYNRDVDDFDFRKTWFAHVDDYDMEESEWRELYDFETVTAWQPLPTPYKE